MLGKWQVLKRVQKTQVHPCRHLRRGGCGFQPGARGSPSEGWGPTMEAAAQLDRDAFGNTLTAQVSALELVSLARVMPQAEIFRWLWYNQGNTCFTESLYLATMCPSCAVLGLTINMYLNSFYVLLCSSWVL